MYPASSSRFEWVSRLPSVRPRVSRAQVNAAARFRNRSAMIRRRVAWWITGSKERNATRPPGLGSPGQIQSAAKQDEPAGQRGDQREPLARQEEVSAEQEAADEGRSHQEDASENPEPPFGGIVTVQTQEAHGDHANALRREHPSELGDGNLRDRDRRESGEDDPHDDGAREEAFPSLGGTPWDHEAYGAPQGSRRDQPDGGPGRPEDGEQDPEGVVPVPVTRETDQDAEQCIADEDRRRHDAPDHPGEAARTTGEGPVEPLDSADLRDRGVRREPFAFVNVCVHGYGIRPGEQADIGSLRRRAFPGAFGRARSPNSLRRAEWALATEPDPDEGQEEAQGRDADPHEDHQVRRRENRFHLSDVSDDLVDVEVPSKAHPGGPEAGAHEAHRGPPPSDSRPRDRHKCRRQFRHKPFAMRFHDERKSVSR